MKHSLFKTPAISALTEASAFKGADIPGGTPVAAYPAKASGGSIPNISKDKRLSCNTCAPGVLPGLGNVNPRGLASSCPPGDISGGATSGPNGIGLNIWPLLEWFYRPM